MTAKETNFPFVSIIIPCRNEARFIKQCLDSILDQNYPKDKIEILVIDGMSSDGTGELVKKYEKQLPFLKTIPNPEKITPIALNRGIKMAQGDIIVRMDAHAVYNKDYVSKCVEYLQKYQVDNVGGVIKNTPFKNTLIAKAVAVCFGSSFGAGNSYFRIGSKKPRLVDTVFGGCYKKEIFKKIGYFNEKLVRTQDIEFNLRLKKTGRKRLLAPDIVALYYPKSSLNDFFAYNFKSGFWVVYHLKFSEISFGLRHYIPCIFVIGLLVTILLGIASYLFFWLFLLEIGLYLAIDGYFSTKISFKEKDWRLLIVLPLMFASRHIIYGAGSLFGFIRLLI